MYMAGNVWEWCLDLHDDDFYFTSPRKNPRSGTNEPEWIMDNFMEITAERVLRGRVVGALHQKVSASPIASGFYP